MVNSVRWTLNVLGWLAAALSLSSSISHLFDVPLNVTLGEVVTYYRDLTRPVIDLLEVPFVLTASLMGLHWDIPEWLKDLHTLSIIGGAVEARAAIATHDPGEDGPNFPTGMWITGVVMGLTGIGLLYLLLKGPKGLGYFVGSTAVDVVGGRVPKAPPPHAKNEEYYYGRFVAAVLVGLVVFFVLNSW